MSFSVDTLLREFAAMAGSIPLFALQAAAMLGLLGAAMVLTRQAGRPIVRREIYLGLALGVAGYMIAWFISGFMRGAIKPNLSIDILILGGLLGGWRGGLACLAIMLGARLQFSGSANLLAAVLDNSVHVLAGCLLRHHLHPGLLQAFSGRTVLVVWGARIVSTYVGIFLAAPFADISGEMLGRLAVMRATLLPLSLFILYAALLMVYVDAQTDVQREREARLAAAQDQAALSLAESEARFRRLFEHAPVALSFADQQGHIVGVNSRFRRLLGYAQADIPRMADWWSAACPDPDYCRASAARWDEEVRRAVKEEREIPPSKFRVVARNGKGRTVLMAGAVIGGDILSSFQDVTEQEAAEAALRESEARYRQLFEESRDALMVLGPPDWRFVHGNKASWALFAVDQGAAFKGYSPWMLAPEFQPDGRNSRDGAKEMIAIALRDGVCQFEWLHRTTTGREFPALVQLTRLERDGVAFVQANVRDISAQKRAENAIRESEERLRNLFERVEKISVQAYDESSRVIFWNKASEALYGYSAEEALGRRLEELIIPPGMRGQTVAAIETWLATGVPVPAGELELQRKDGSTVAVFSSHALMQTRHGREMYCVDIDLTEVRQAHARLKLAASVFTHAREGIVITSPCGRVIDLNARFCEICGHEREALIGRQSDEVLLSELQGPAFYAALRQDLLEYGQWSGEIWRRRGNGELYAQMLNIHAVRKEDGSVTHYVALVNDVTSLRVKERQLAHVANFDALTSLPNRKLLCESLNALIGATSRSGRLLAVVYLDLDGFKQINDRYGQDIGNRLLMVVAQRMREALRSQDLVARMGGDEFVAVLEGLDDEAACWPLLEAVQAAVSGEILVEGQRFEMSASLGVSFYPQGDEIDADQLLRQADQAMYQAKLAGKNRYARFDAERDRGLRGDFETREAIRLALQRGEFVLHYQPKVNLRSGEVIGSEALIRWQHPERGLLPPLAFLPVVEESDLAVEMDEWVIDAALSQLAAWSEEGFETSVSVNIGGRQLLKPGFEQRLEARLQRHSRVRPGQLEIEVLESSALTDLARAGQVIKACRELGVGFAIDDFGTGYSSLTYLKHLPVGVLKIDQSFVREMLSDRDSIAILEGIIELARAFDRKVIAEGVETGEHAEMLLRLGCVYAQGYGIARPMQADALPAWQSAWCPDPVWAGIRRVRREELEVLHAIVEHRAWLAEFENHLCRNGARVAFPELLWASLPAESRQAEARDAQRQLLSLVSNLLFLKENNRGHEALAQLSELTVLSDRLARELLALLQHTTEQRGVEALVA